MQITFYGGVGGVTGSRHIVRSGGDAVQLDCGMFQGRRRTVDELNRSAPVSPESVDSAILGHAHIDHSGGLPRFVSRGYDGPIVSTPATRDLCSLMLRDSARIQEKDAEYFNRRLKRRRSRTRKRDRDRYVKPLYTSADVSRTLDLFVSVNYHNRFAPGESVGAEFLDAGHILGSALTVLDLSHRRRRTRMLYAVDLGRHNLPILRDPEYADDVETLVIESTYGDREHEDVQTVENTLARIVCETHERGGKIIVPAFSVERTQEFVYVLHELERDGRIPPMPVYVDSPLSTNVTLVFKLHHECFDEETFTLLDNNEDPFGLASISYIRDVEDSKALNSMKGPAIIISASGMCEAGRILHHLANHATDPRNTVLVIGFMAHGTLGRRIVEGAPTMRIFGEDFPLRANVEVLGTFSAHADRSDLIDYTMKTAERGNLKRVYLVHGDPEASMTLAAILRERLPKVKVAVPSRGDTLPL
jgi:metallo-beta-lactamase family protein